MDNAPCLPHACPLPHPLSVKIVIPIIKKKNGNYVELDFSFGTVLVIFSFFWMDNAPCPPPLSPPICKTFNIHRRKKRFRHPYTFQHLFPISCIITITSLHYNCSILLLLLLLILHISSSIFLHLLTLFSFFSINNSTSSSASVSYTPYRPICCSSWHHNKVSHGFLLSSTQQTIHYSKVYPRYMGHKVYLPELLESVSARKLQEAAGILSICLFSFVTTYYNKKYLQYVDLVLLVSKTSTFDSLNSQYFEIFGIIWINFMCFSSLYS